eukprot:8750282-Pyramimonas_sp.AAC.1
MTAVNGLAAGPGCSLAAWAHAVSCRLSCARRSSHALDFFAQSLPIRVVRLPLGGGVQGHAVAAVHSDGGVELLKMAFPPLHKRPRVFLQYGQ